MSRSIVVGSHTVAATRARAVLNAVTPGTPCAGLGPVAELRAAELHAGSMKAVARGVKVGVPCFLRYIAFPWLFFH